MKNIRVRKITGVAVLLALVIIFQTIGNFVMIGPVNINLSLIPIAIGAIVFGPFAGAFLGFGSGVLSLFSASTQELFMSVAPAGTVVTCLLKCTIAGLVAGLVFKLISKKNVGIAAIIASLLVPLINTGLFVGACFSIMKPALDNYSKTSGNVNLMQIVFLGWAGVNFLFEFGVTAVLSPAIIKIMKLMTRSNKHAL